MTAATNVGNHRRSRPLPARVPEGEGHHVKSHGRDGRENNEGVWKNNEGKGMTAFFDDRKPLPAAEVSARLGQGAVDDG